MKINSSITGWKVLGNQVKMFTNNVSRDKIQDGGDRGDEANWDNASRDGILEYKRGPG